MPKVIKRNDKPGSSVSDELKKFLMSSSESKRTLPVMQREKSPKEAVTDEVLVNHNICNNKQSKKEARNFKESQQKLLNMIGKQSELRKQGNKKLIRTLSAITTAVESDLTNMREGVKIFQQRTIDHLKFLDQSVNAFYLRLQAMKDMSAAYKTEIEEYESKEKEQTEQLCEELNNDIKELQDNLVTETRQAYWETLLEGLLTKGAMKPNDRPIWYDVYKRFPPAEEPKFARPKPNIPIRPIFYKEDIARAKIHSQGYGLGAVNMLIPGGDTHTKKLVQQYEKLEAEGVPEDQIVEKCAILVDAERKKEVPSPNMITDTFNQSVTQQVLADADIKNIFQEEKK